MPVTMHNPAHADEILRECVRAVPAGKAAKRLLKGLARAMRNLPISHVACICSAALLIGLSACSMQDARNMLAKLTPQTEEPTEPAPPAQPAQPTKPAKAVKPAIHAKAVDPLLDATQQDLVDYLHGKLIALSPSDGINDNLEVKFDLSTSTLTVLQPGSHCDQFLNALDTNNMSWDIFDPSDAHNSREALLRLTVTSVRGKTARACFGEKGQPAEGVSTNRVRLLFSLAKSEQIPGFQNKMTKVVKKLIVLSGGAQEKELFPEARGKSGSENK